MLLGVLLFGQGCYTYHQVDPTAVPSGAEVRVLLREDRHLRLRTDAASEGYQLDGSLVRLTEDSLSLSMLLGEAHRGSRLETVRQEFTFPRGDVLRVEHRRFSRWRTTLLGTGLAIGIVALIRGIGEVEHDGVGRDGELPLPPVPPTELLIPR